MIDFTTIFAKQEIERLSFKTRRDVNYDHEIIFLSSYLHDASFKREDFRQQGGTITINLLRDCWEFYTRVHRVGDELLRCRSKLSISGVDLVRWNPDSNADRMDIKSVFIGEHQHLEEGVAHLVLISVIPYLRIDLMGTDDFFDIELLDQEDPH